MTTDAALIVQGWTEAGPNGNQYSWAWDGLEARVGTEGISTWIQEGLINSIQIKALQKTPAGSECLRLIVRDDIKGCGDTIANALWGGLK